MYFFYLADIFTAIFFCNIFLRLYISRWWKNVTKVHCTNNHVVINTHGMFTRIVLIILVSISTFSIFIMPVLSI